jgi:hypothetical protein
VKPGDSLYFLRDNHGALCVKPWFASCPLPARQKKTHPHHEERNPGSSDRSQYNAWVVSRLSWLGDCAHKVDESRLREQNFRSSWLDCFEQLSLITE